MKRWKPVVAAISGTLIWASHASVWAAPSTVSGCGLSGNQTCTYYFGGLPGALEMPSAGDPIDARKQFEERLVKDSVLHESFDSQTLGYSGPLKLFGNSSTLTGVKNPDPEDPLKDINRVGNLSCGDDGSCTGRFDTTQGDTTQGSGQSHNWWESKGGGTIEELNDFVIDFKEAVAAFGFYATDVGDFGGTLTLILAFDGGEYSIEVPKVTGPLGTGDAEVQPTLDDASDESSNDVEPPNGGLLFFGVLDSNVKFTSARFRITQGEGPEDFLGFDDLVIGALPSSQPPGIPEPGTLALALACLGALGLARSRRNR